MSQIKKICKHLILLALLISITFSASYQQHRHFKIEDPRGLDDTISYVRMSQGNFDVSPVHVKRVVIPGLAAIASDWLRPLSNAQKSNLNRPIAEGRAMMM